MEYLKQSTAFTETVGPILDSTGAEYTGAVIGDLSISKNGTEAAMAAAATLTHVSNGHYTLVGTTGNSDTLGRVTIRCNKSTYQMPVKEYMVLPATTYDALVTNAAGGANGLLLSLASNAVDVGKWLGTAVSTPTVAGIPNVNAKTWNDLATVALPLVPTVAGRTLDVSAGGEAGLDWANVGTPGSTVNLSATTLNLVNTVTTLTNLPAITANWLTAAGIADGAIDSATFAADTGLQSIRSSTATAGAAGTITLDASASAVDNFYQGAWIRLTGGTGAGQARLISSYVGSTKVATVHRNWATNPDNTTTFAVINAADIYGVVLADTITTYTGNTVQTGDSYARIGANGISLSAIPDLAGVTTLLSRIGGSITISGGKVAATMGATDYSGNTVQTGDAYARIGAAGAGLTALGDTRIANLDATISSRMATFTLPTNFSSMAIDASGRVTVGAFLSTLDLTATMKASVNTEADTALADYDAPTHAEMTAELATADDATLAAIAAVAADLPGRITKNVALAGFSFPMFDSSDHVTLKTGLTITATRSLDGAAFAACTNAAAEIGSTGVYKIDLAAADTNGNVVVLKFAGGSGADVQVITLITQVT